MTNAKIARILKDHSIEAKTVVDRIMALEEGTIKQGDTVRPHSEWIDVTGWGGMRLLTWLDYDQHAAREYLGL